MRVRSDSSAATALRLSSSATFLAIAAAEPALPIPDFTICAAGRALPVQAMEDAGACAGHPEYCCAGRYRPGSLRRPHAHPHHVPQAHRFSCAS